MTVLEKIESLIEAANTASGETHNNLTDAIKPLLIGTEEKPILCIAPMHTTSPMSSGNLVAAKTLNDGFTRCGKPNLAVAIVWQEVSYTSISNDIVVASPWVLTKKIVVEDRHKYAYIYQADLSTFDFSVDSLYFKITENRNYIGFIDAWVFSNANEPIVGEFESISSIEPSKFEVNTDPTKTMIHAIVFRGGNTNISIPRSQFYVAGANEMSTRLGQSFIGSDTKKKDVFYTLDDRSTVYHIPITIPYKAPTPITT